ncbi:MAG TPA: ester cyclase [Actinomycetes bacterium]|nr:ester cyclase [Actinomycetes bacterium]
MDAGGGDGSDILERLRRPVTPELYERVRQLWIRHSVAEDERDLEGLISTLTPDCVYEVVPTGQRWEGHEGARAFYTTFLGAFPDVKFHLTDIAIGPQGVIEVADLTGTHRGTWAGIRATGLPVRLQVVISFPWHPEAELFTGERVWFDRGALTEQVATA